MPNKNRKLREIFAKLWWWQPIAVLIIISLIGVFTNFSNSKDTQVAVSDSELSSIYESFSEEMLSSEVSSEEELSTAEAETEAYFGSQFEEAVEELSVKEDGNYTSKEEVALYIHTYNKLPNNYISKKKAEEEGWDSKTGNLDMVLPGMSIGGSSFGNYEGKLPKAENRKYFECDIDYHGGYRNAKRLVYSNDGLIFYTEDHYNTFEQLY